MLTHNVKYSGWS